jgi:hypothetical protein
MLAVTDDRHTVDHNMHHSCRVLVRFLECRVIRYRLRVEYHYVGKIARRESPA